MEWIKYHEAEKVFDLRTENSTYQMQVREYDTLVHLYYGCPVGDSLITDRIVCVDRGFSGNGDYRINGLEVEQADGSDTANLKFESYEITKGKYSLKGLPAMFAKEDEAVLLKEFRTYLKDDPVKTDLIDMTRLGLVEVTRKKIKKSLRDSLKMN